MQALLSVHTRGVVLPSRAAVSAVSEVRVATLRIGTDSEVVPICFLRTFNAIVAGPLQEWSLLTGSHTKKNARQSYAQ